MSDKREAEFRFATSLEEIRGITWDLDGVELSHQQAIQRIINANFPVKGGVALTMFAIVEGESGEYTKAWHANVNRDASGNIVRLVDDGKTYMKVNSVDLGFMQFNTPVGGVKVEMTTEAAGTFIDNLFEQHPELADPWTSAALAYDLWLRRKFQPWYAYKPGTPAFLLKKRYGALAFGNWLARSFVDPKLTVIYKT